MEDKDKNVAPKPGKSIWKKSNFKKENGEKCKKIIRFNLNVDVLSDDGNQISSPKRDGKPSIGEPSPKKRKKDVEMPNISNEVEREIEMQYHSKAKESKLTTRNVKSILKSVITNKYVVDMVRAVEEGGFSNLPFEPKLTRAKTKELLQLHPDVPVPPVVGLLTPAMPSAAELSPEVKLLIDKDLAEDSSDEEYNPENEPEPSEDEEKGDMSVTSDLDSLPPTPSSSQAPPTPVHETSYDWSQDGIFKVPQENVGQRTRSKLDFQNLPLECLEQAYVPPDITPDMYEAKCDNPDWQDFLTEFTQPLAPNETLDDDPDNDPEYNILEDEEKIQEDPVDYKEEMRKDKAVKVSKKELNSLMKELFETDSLSSDDEVRTSESIAELEASIMKETEDRQRREEEEKKKKQIGFHPNQRLLLAQQLRQHVQLTAQHFVQTYRHPVYHRHAATCRTMLVTLSGLKNDNVCCQETHNLAAALDTVTRWERIHDHPQTGDKIRQFVAEQIKAETAQKRSKKKMVQRFPVEMMSLVMESEVVLYPMLLPPAPFLTSLKAVGPYYFTSSEDMLLAISLEQVTQLMDDNKDVYKKRSLTDICRVVSESCIPRSSPRTVAAHVRKLKGSKVMNPVKAFFEIGKPPIVCHYVIPVWPGKKLYQQPSQLLPEVWRSFLAQGLAFKDKEESLKEKSEKVSDAQEKPSEIQKESRVKEKDLPKPQKRNKATTKEVKTMKNQMGIESNKGAKEEAKEESKHKEIPKTMKKVTFNNIIQKASTSNPISLSLCDKPKTTKKDIRNMLARASSIQNAIGLNGQVTLDNDQSKKLENKPRNPVKIKQKAGAYISPTKITGKTKNKEITYPKHKVKSSIRCSNSTLSDKIDGGTSNKLLKSKKKSSGKKNAKMAVLKSKTADLNNTVVPKMKFKVVSKTTTYYLKSENKEEEKRLVETKYIAETTNQQQYFNSLELLPKVVGIQENELPNTCSSKTPSTTTQFNSYSYLGSQIYSESVSHQPVNKENDLPKNSSSKAPSPTTQFNSCSYLGSQIHSESVSHQPVNKENDLPKNCSSKAPSTTTQSNSYSYLGSHIHSESDSHQSNSVESERTPLCVNIVKSCISSSASHCPRPPSTVKLKDRLNSESNFTLCSGKIKVPSLSVYSQLNGTS